MLVVVNLAQGAGIFCYVIESIEHFKLVVKFNNNETITYA